MNLLKCWNANEKCNEVNSKNWPKDINQIIIAINTEIGEFTNELQTFKWWKACPTTNWEKAIEEYVDILFFLFVYYKVTKKSFNSIVNSEDISKETTWSLICKLYKEPTVQNWYNIGKKIEFTDEEIEKAFLKKVEINLKRWKNNY